MNLLQRKENCNAALFMFVVPSLGGSSALQPPGGGTTNRIAALAVQAFLAVSIGLMSVNTLPALSLAQATSNPYIFDPAVANPASGAAASQQAFNSPLDNPFNDTAAPMVVQQPSPPDGVFLPSGAMPPVDADGTELPINIGTVPYVVSTKTIDQTPRDSRPGVFQSINFTDTFLPRTGSNGMMIDDAEATVVFGLPLPTRDSPLVITPGFAAHFFDGPDSLFVPARTFDAYTQFRWLPKITDCLRFDMQITPGYFGDYDRDGHKGIRETGYFTGVLNLSDHTQLILGADYTDNKTYLVLPIAGILWKPDDNAEYRLVFPQPRISFRLAADGIYLRELDPATTNFGSEWWVYVGGELGGGTWAVQRPGEGVDLLNYSDIRVTLGLQHKIYRGISSKLEVGYVFDRKIIYDSDSSEEKPTSTGMARAGLWY
jgi:hypothetical protein